VSVPKFKTHNLTLLTGAIKNLFGLVSGTFKIELHKNYFEDKAFASMLVDILKEVKPALTVVDGIVAMEGDGPGTSGKLRQVNLLLASADCVALDSVLALIMGIQPDRVLSTKEAAERNLGIADINSINILGEPLDKAIIGKPFLLPAASAAKKVPLPIINIAKNLLKFYPCVEHNKCIRCATCIKACPNNVISMKNGRIRLDYRRCIACFCCQEVCPAAAIKTKKSWVAKLMGL
jgi:Pyruvate/2-oxoacid:ferredoxin oxidoreductase delta subunit